MRDQLLKDKKHFDKWINDFYQSIDRVTNWILTGKTPVDRINIMKQSMVQTCINTITCKYSAGYPVSELKWDLLKAIDLTDESWVDNAWKIKIGNPTGSIILNQYSLSSYDDMLWMLSLGYLLEIDNKQFTKLVGVIDRDKVKDYLFEFIIRAKIKERKPIIEESYQKFFGIPNLYKKLREAIVTTDKAKAEKLVKEFIIKNWYKGHKESGWYDSHKCESYFGYWSFETAAVVKIMGLDDSSFIDCPYYPKDLVHQEK